MTRPSVVRRRPSPRPLAESESVLQQKILQLARTARWRTYHTWNSLHSGPGFPDVVLVRGKRLVFAELKSEGGVISPDQQAWLEALCQVPCAEVYVWRPSDWTRIVRVLFG